MQYRTSKFEWPLIGPIAAYMAAPVLFALLALIIAIPVSFRPVYADHALMRVVCPSPVWEGGTGQMRIETPGRKNVAVSVFTFTDGYTASSNDFKEYDGVRMESESDESSIRVPVVTKEDTEAEHDETFSVGFRDGGEWHGCVVTIEDDDRPEITGVEINSSPNDGSSYRDGEAIEVKVNTDAKVEVEGAPVMSLYIGGSGESGWRGAKFDRGSGSRSLVFRYKVQPGDFDSDGISVSGAASDDDGTAAYGFSGNIYAAGTDVPIEYGHPGLQAGQSHSVDGRPYVQGVEVNSSPPDGWEAYRADQTIEFTFGFNTDVVVEGDVTIGVFVGRDDLDWSDKYRQAGYLRGSGSDTIVFGYTVRPGDMDSQGITLQPGTDSAGFGGGGAIKAKGTDVEMNPHYPGSERLSGHKIDTEVPAVSSVNITSRPANGQAYGAGEDVSVKVAFSEDVTPRGGLTLGLDIGGEVRQATLQPLPEGSFVSALVFQYTVQLGDEDADGIGIGANSMLRNGGGVYDIAGNSAALSHDTVVADSGQKVNTTPED